MKAVLYNDFKLVRNIILPLMVFITAILFVGFLVTGQAFNRFLANGLLQLFLSLGPKVFLEIILRIFKSS